MDLINKLTVLGTLLVSFILIPSSSAVIKVGDSLPNAMLHEFTPQTKVNLLDAIKGKKVVILGLPGAFTPNCSQTHVPGFLAREKEIKSKGIDEIFVVSVNDAFVMNAWCKDNKAENKLRFLADPDLELTKALGLETMIKALGGLRSKRYTMVVDHGKVTQLNVEPDGISLTCSLAENLKL